MSCWHRAQLPHAPWPQHTSQSAKPIARTRAASPRHSDRRRRSAPRMAALLAQLTGGSARLHARISTCQSDLSRADVNIVHVVRPHAALADGASAALATRQQLKQAVVIDARRPLDAALEHLLSVVELPELQQQQLHADVAQAVQLLSATLQQDHARVAVEVVCAQSCPRWHADSVRLRMLCTYAGPGTWFVPNRHVRRVSNAWTGDVAIAAVDSRHALQASAGDWLLLKGNGFPGFAGAGAVHKSPALEEGERRLLLTVDDACGCPQ